MDRGNGCMEPQLHEKTVTAHEWHSSANCRSGSRPDAERRQRAENTVVVQRLGSEPRSQCVDLHFLVRCDAVLDEQIAHSSNVVRQEFKSDPVRSTPNRYLVAQLRSTQSDGAEVAVQPHCK